MTQELKSSIWNISKSRRQKGGFHLGGGGGNTSYTALDVREELRARAVVVVVVAAGGDDTKGEGEEGEEGEEDRLVLHLDGGSHKLDSSSNDDVDTNTNSSSSNTIAAAADVATEDTSTSGIRQRRNKTQQTNNDEPSSSSSQHQQWSQENYTTDDDDDAKYDQKLRNTDPLYLFGALPPPDLKKAQTQMKHSLDYYIHAANLAIQINTITSASNTTTANTTNDDQGHDATTTATTTTTIEEIASAANSNTSSSEQTTTTTAGAARETDDCEDHSTNKSTTHTTTTTTKSNTTNTTITTTQTQVTRLEEEAIEVDLEGIKCEDDITTTRHNTTTMPKNTTPTMTMMTTLPSQSNNNDPAKYENNKTPSPATTINEVATNEDLTSTITTTDRTSDDNDDDYTMSTATKELPRQQEQTIKLETTSKELRNNVLQETTTTTTTTAAAAACDDDDAIDETPQQQNLHPKIERLPNVSVLVPEPNEMKEVEEDEPTGGDISIIIDDDALATVDAQQETILDHPSPTTTTTTEIVEGEDTTNNCDCSTDTTIPPELVVDPNKIESISTNLKNEEDLDVVVKQEKEEKEIQKEEGDGGGSSDLFSNEGQTVMEETTTTTTTTTPEITVDQSIEVELDKMKCCDGTLDNTIPQQRHDDPERSKLTNLEKALNMKHEEVVEYEQDDRDLLKKKEMATAVEKDETVDVEDTNICDTTTDSIRHSLDPEIKRTNLEIALDMKHEEVEYEEDGNDLPNDDKSAIEEQEDTNLDESTEIIDVDEVVCDSVTKKIQPNPDPETDLPTLNVPLDVTHDDMMENEDDETDHRNDDISTAAEMHNTKLEKSTEIGDVNETECDSAADKIPHSLDPEIEFPSLNSLTIDKEVEDMKGASDLSNDDKPATEETQETKLGESTEIVDVEETICDSATENNHQSLDPEIELPTITLDVKHDVEDMKGASGLSNDDKPGTEETQETKQGESTEIVDVEETICDSATENNHQSLDPEIELPTITLDVKHDVIEPEDISTDTGDFNKTECDSATDNVPQSLDPEKELPTLDISLKVKHEKAEDEEDGSDSSNDKISTTEEKEEINQDESTEVADVEDSILADKVPQSLVPSNKLSALVKVPDMNKKARYEENGSELPNEISTVERKPLSIADKWKVIQGKLGNTPNASKPKPLKPISRNLAADRMRMIRERQAKFENLGKSSSERNINPISRNLTAEKKKLIQEKQSKLSDEPKLDKPTVTRNPDIENM